MATPDPPAPPWSPRAEELARWALARLVNRTDRCGRYFYDAPARRARPYADPARPEDARPGYLSHTRLVQHFRATRAEAVLGVYAYGADKCGKWACIDIDNHDDTADPRANERYALHLARKLGALGLCALLYESNGRGGFHLWALFTDPVPAWTLRALGRWLVADHAGHGLPHAPEVFPKGAGDTPWGNWVRLPGRHHTRDVWPRVWNGTHWATGAAAVAHVLSRAGAAPGAIPPEAATFGIEVETGGGPPRPDRPPGVTFAWEEFNERATVPDVVALLARHGWTAGHTRADGAVEMIRPGKGAAGAQGGNVLSHSGAPVFFCFTDAAPPLAPLKGYTPAALVALLEHHGDFKVSNKALYEAGFGTRVPPAGTGARAEPAPPAPAPAPAKGGAEDSELVFTPVSGIVPEAVHFLVPGYVPRGMVGMLAGDGGHGKSMITLELAAALSAGRCAFGLTYPNPPRGKTLLISCEDDWARTILPRLAALGADRANVLRVEGVRMKKDGKVKLLDFHMGHYAQLERALVANPDIGLIVIDPAGAYIGRAGVNENQDAELRGVLGPLSEAANRTGATVLLIKHLNKSAGVSAVQRVGGGGAYVNAVRFSYMVAPDPDEPEKKLMLPLKTNVLKSGLTGLAYRLVDVPHADGVSLLLNEWPAMKDADADALARQLFRPQWEGGVEADANTVSGGRASRTASKQSVSECQEFLRAFLGVWAWPEKEVEEAMRKAGFTFSVYRQAKAGLRTEDKHDPARLSGLPIESGGAWWVWIGPQHSRPQDRPPFARQSGQSPPASQTGHPITSSLLIEREEIGGGTTGKGHLFSSPDQSDQSFQGIPPCAQVEHSEFGPGPEPI